jgi:hypothetical protein
VRPTFRGVSLMGVDLMGGRRRSRCGCIFIFRLFNHALLASHTGELS